MPLAEVSGECQQELTNVTAQVLTDHDSLVKATERLDATGGSMEVQLATDDRSSITIVDS